MLPLRHKMLTGEAEPCLVSKTAETDAEWTRDAFGMGQYTAGRCDHLLSWVVFLLLAPVLLIVWLPLSCICCASPVLLVQRFAGWVLSGCLARTYLGVLLIRLCGKCDLILTGMHFIRTGSQRFWMDTLDPQDWAYHNETYGRNIILWANLRVGSYKQVRDIVLNPARKRTRALDGWISGFARHYPNLPIFFNTGSNMHTTFRQIFFANFTKTDFVLRALEDEGAGLAKMAAPILQRWLAGSFRESKSGEGNLYMVEPVAPLILFLLFEVEVESIPPELLTAFSDVVTVGASYFLLPPHSPYWLLSGKVKAIALLKDFLLEHCNAARPESLKGRAVDWRSLAAQMPAFLPKDECRCPCSGTPAVDPVDAYLEVISVMVCVAGVTGTTNGFTSVIRKFADVPVGPTKSRWPSAPVQWRPDADDMVRLYRRDPLGFILEALRLGTPVAGTHQVLEEELTCPFLRKEVTFPKGTMVCADLNACHMDPEEWGSDSLEFKPGRAARDRYLMWNGPFGGDAPRQCPGEQVAAHCIKVSIDAFLDMHRPQ